MNNREKTVVVMRSSSEDIDIPIILLAIGLDNLYAFIDNGTGKYRRLFHLNACELSGLAYKHFQGMTTSHRFCGKESLRFGRWRKSANHFEKFFQSLVGKILQARICSLT